MRKTYLSALIALAFGTAFAVAQGAGPGLVTTPPSGSTIDLNTTSPTNVAITADNLAAWVGSSGSQGNSVIGTGVNKVSLAGAATTVAPVITVGGTSSDTNIGLVVAGKGTGALLLGGSTIANASVTVPTVASAVNQVELRGAVTSTGIPSITVAGTTADTNAAISLSGKGTGATLIGGTTATLAGLQVAQTASRVNNLVVTPGATGTPPSVVVGGTTVDANVGLFIAGNGTGPVYIGGTSTTLAGLQVAQTASRVNNIAITPAATGNSPVIAIGGAGADTNRDLSVAAAGTGIVALGQARATCSGTTTATCQGQRFTVSITGLTTAAGGTTSAAMTVTNGSVASSAVLVHCQVNGYSGGGQPIATNVNPGTGQVALTITNVAGSGALDATVPVACVVF